MAKKQHLSKIEMDTAMIKEIEKLKIESSYMSNLPTTATVNESVERLTTTPERIGNAAEMVVQVMKEKKATKTEIERGRDAKGELNRVGITALIDRDILKDVKIFAIKKGVSMSDVINDALNKYLNA